MRRETRAALLAGLAFTTVVIPNGLAATRFAVEFAEPAWATGEVGATGVQWVYLVFHTPSRASYDVRAARATSATNYTVLYEKRWDQAVERGSHTIDYPPSQTQFSNGFDAGLRFTDYGWSSLYIEADRIQLRERDSDSRIGLVQAGENLQDNFPPMYVPSEFFSRHLHSINPSVVISARGLDKLSLPVELNATGLRRLEWLNTTLSCHAGPC